jgi:hypothetical protein
LERTIECRTLAANVTGAEVRDLMLQLANQWMQLLIFANQKSRTTPHTSPAT